jgi:hypothetical protein
MELFQFEAYCRTQAGALDAAMESCRGILQCGRTIGEEPAMISMLVRMSAQMSAVRGLERVLAQGQPGQAALARLQQLLETEAAQPLFLIGFRGERALAHDLLQKVQNGHLDILGLTGSMGWGGRSMALPIQELGLLFTGTLPGQWAAFLHYQNELVEIIKLPEAQQEARFKLLEATLPSQPMLVQLVPGRARFSFAQRRCLSDLRCGIVMLAMERYRQAQGHWPETLMELVPDYLSAIPADPFDGMPLRYRRRNSGAVIYTVGYDLVDNGGTFIPNQPTATGSDLGLEIWDPRWRRQAPADPTFVGPLAPPGG